MKTPFLGGTYTSKSRNIAYSRAVNLYPEKVETKQGKAVGGFYGCPGLLSLTTAGMGPIRGGTTAGGFGYVVSGSEVYKISNLWVATLLGSITTSSGPVDLVANPTQVLISDGTAGYVITIATDAFAAVGTFPTGANTLAYQDGFALTNIVGTNKFYQSNLNDFTVWNALNFSTADGQPGNTIALRDVNRELWVMCDNNTEVWVNVGGAGFVFQRIQGVYIEVGCSAPYSAVHNVDQTMMWLGQNENGRAICYRSRGYVADRVSTHAIEETWQGYSNTADAIAYAYQQEGHTFYVITFPSGDATWAYDITTGLWHERASLGTRDGLFHKHWSNCHFFFNQKNVVGDYRNGSLYALDLNTYTDAGTPRKWLRTWRAFMPGEEKFEPFRFNGIQIDCQTGINVPDGTNPQVALRWSNDGGWSWAGERLSPFGKTGETSNRVLFRRLGQTSRKKGFDRVWELSCSDACPAALIGADMDAEKT